MESTTVKRFLNTPFKCLGTISNLIEIIEFGLIGRERTGVPRRDRLHYRQYVSCGFPQEDGLSYVFTSVCRFTGRRVTLRGTSIRTRTWIPLLPWSGPGQGYPSRGQDQDRGTPHAPSDMTHASCSHAGALSWFS